MHPCAFVCVHTLVSSCVCRRLCAYTCTCRRQRARLSTVGEEAGWELKLQEPPSCSLLFSCKEQAGVLPVGACCSGMGQGKAGLGELSLPHSRHSSQPMSRLFSLLPVGKLRQGPARVTHLRSQPLGTAWASLTPKLVTFPPLPGWGYLLCPPAMRVAGPCGSWLPLDGPPTPHPWRGKGAVHVSSPTEGLWPPSSAQCSHKIVGPSYISSTLPPPLPSIACPKNSRSHAALGTALSGQPRTHRAGRA